MVGYEHVGYFCAVKQLKILFRFYVNSSIHLSLALVALTCITILSLDLNSDIYLLLFVFFGSISGYNFIKYFDFAKHRVKSPNNSVKYIQVFSSVSFLLALFFLVHLPFNIQLIAFFCGMITILYALPIFPKGKSLRTFNGFKIFIIAGVCSIVTVLLPFYQLSTGTSETVLMLFIQRFFFILAVLLPFEIRDLKMDSISLGTIPQKIGVQRTKLLGLFFLVVFMVLSTFLHQGFQAFFWSDFMIAIVAGILLWFSSSDQKKYYASFWVEGVPIMWLFLVWGVWLLFG